MAYTACCNLFEFALQVLLRRVPDWEAHPCVALAHDTPQARVLGCNAAAAELGVQPGMRYAAVLEFAPQVYAAGVSQAELHQHQQRVIAGLYALTDEVLCKPGDPGVLWANAAGFALLQGSPRAWAQQLSMRIERLGFRSRIVLGFTRFGSYLVSAAAQTPAVELLQSVEDERRKVAEVPLHAVVTSRQSRRRLARLGIRTAGALVQLPRSELRSRFGADVELVHRQALGECELPAQHAAVPVQPVASRRPPQPLISSEQILLETQRLLEALVQRLPRGECIAALTLQLSLDDRGQRRERIVPANPTEQVAVLLRLLRLRLERAVIDQPVSALRIEAELCRAAVQQHQLFRETVPERSGKQAVEAFAALRASLGEEAVRYVQLVPHHLPERRVQWRQGAGSQELSPRGSVQAQYADCPGTAQMVRRAFISPQPLARHLLRSGKLIGPYLLSCDWWQSPSRRLYYYYVMSPASDESTSALWVYYDLDRRRWMLQGTV